MGGAVRKVTGRRRLERVTSGVVGLRVEAAAPHEGAERVGVGHEDDGVDELCQRPARLRSGKHQLLQEDATNGQFGSARFENQVIDLSFILFLPAAPPLEG